MQFRCKVVRNFFFINFISLKENTNTTNSFFNKNHYFDIVLVFISFSFYFKDNTNATIHVFLDYFFFAKVPLLYDFLHIVKKRNFYVYLVQILSVFVIDYFSIFFLFLNGNTNAAHSFFLRKFNSLFYGYFYFILFLYFVSMLFSFFFFFPSFFII